jgi:hypothetical protein
MRKIHSGKLISNSKVIGYLNSGSSWFWGRRWTALSDAAAYGQDGPEAYVGDPCRWLLPRPSHHEDGRSHAQRHLQLLDLPGAAFGWSVCFPDDKVIAKTDAFSI